MHIRSSPILIEGPQIDIFPNPQKTKIPLGGWYPPRGKTAQQSRPIVNSYTNDSRLLHRCVHALKRIFHELTYPSPAPPARGARLAFHTLLLNTFDAPQLRVLLGLLRLEAHLPGPEVTLSVLAFEVVVLLERMNLLEEALDLLRHERPRHRVEIELVRRLYDAERQGAEVAPEV
jgi:hypothetical protein